MCDKLQSWIYLNTAGSLQAAVFVMKIAIKNLIFGHVTHKGDHVMVPELRKYQIQVPRQILIGIVVLLLFQLKIKNLIFGHVTF